MLRFLDAGESHGRALIAIIDGIPSNADIDINFINNQLKRRQGGYGRGKRMNIEKDKVKIYSGLRGNKTTGNPITMIIYNKDFENWKNAMEQQPKENEKITIPRPGHGDFVGYFKYNTNDIRDVIERTSARETAIRTAVGALCKSILFKLNIDIRSKIQSLGKICDDKVDIYNDNIYDKIESSPLRCFNENIEEKMKNKIDKCRKEGETLGGSIYISIKGVPLGIGSYTQWDRKLDAILSYSIMSLQGIKAVEFGEGLNVEKMGSEFNDNIYYHEGTFMRNTNNAGGIEAGISNGENIIIKAYMKPIPSVKKTMHTVDLKSRINVESRYERSDITGVVPASIVLENICAFEILKQLIDKFPSDTFQELKNSLKEYRNKI
ncbi:chorismate synthase [Clostridium niameyense]|uniref:Chorismate synthase n=1 Tax=Clostridium niameyense TaxID=1622073 RepID=A0A6M0R649_9CLOT|nr:chorismate synthase [Clostridium niameyense]NEZ45651.1 chorismate synthase [Clostridium niameyense]